MKTAKDVHNCMVNNICEQVPENGYGYSKASENCPIAKPCPVCFDQKTDEKERSQKYSVVNDANQLWMHSTLN